MNKAKVTVDNAIVRDESRAQTGSFAKGAEVYVFFLTVDNFAYVNAVSDDDGTAGYVDSAELQMEVDPPAAGGTKYTNEGNEVVATSTPLKNADLVATIEKVWPDLGGVGSKSLLAQHLFETGGGRACFNWNRGNFKSDLDIPHFYLQDVWECVSPSTAQIDMAKTPQCCRRATDAELAKPRINCGGGTVTMIYNPPSYMARFRAYDTIDAGTQSWCDYFRLHHPRLVPLLKKGDMAELAHGMKQANYFLGDEASYAAGMQRYFNPL